MVGRLKDVWLTDGGEVLSLTRQPCSTPHKRFFLLLAEETLGSIVRLELLGKLKKTSRTRDLPAFSIVPQPTTLPRAPFQE
jgi:hypothetical protein